MDLIGGIHDSFSLRVLMPFSRLQRSARSATRPTQQAFNEGICFRRAAADWDQEKRVEWILDRLRTTVRRAYDETAYYRALLDRIGPLRRAVMREGVAPRASEPRLMRGETI